MRARAACVRSWAMGDSEELLRRLGASDETTVRTVMALTRDGDSHPAALTPRVRTLVRLAALVAGDAPTTSLYWAVELASGAGVADDDIINVLAIVGSEVGAQQLVSAAPRLALAIGYDVGLDGS
jgi:4-carboxymuconolactone decarboxylase